MLIVVVERARADTVFEAMLTAGQFHLPGRGLMYQLSAGHGMVNLPSRVSDRFYGADMQQVIRAIDHLSGHSHWRDNGLDGLGVPSGGAQQSRQGRDLPALRDQVRLSAIVPAENADAFTDFVLGAGVPGLTVVPTFFTAAEEGCKIAGARVNSEYALYRSIVAPDVATRVGELLQSGSADRELRDLCVFTNAIPRVARYVAGAKDYRAAPLSLGLSEAEPGVSEAPS
ncbi:MAG: hypothetical protein AAGD86_06355 [Pseudomonadota bacterium]